jgi:hypothetical protein
MKPRAASAALRSTGSMVTTGDRTAISGCADRYTVANSAAPPQRQPSGDTRALARATDASQAALGFGVRSNVVRSTDTSPNRGRYP